MKTNNKITKIRKLPLISTIKDSDDSNICSIVELYTTRKTPTASDPANSAKDTM